MASVPVSIEINARNNASREFSRAHAQIVQLGAAAKLVAPAASGAATAAIHQLSGIATALGPIGIAAASAAAAITALGAAFGAARGLADRVEGLERTAKEFGTTTENVQVLQRALQNMGLGADDASTAMSTLARHISEGHPLLAQLGVTSRDIFQAMLQLGDGLEGVADPADRIRASFELMGKGGRTIQGVMGALRAETDHVREIFVQTGGVITEFDKVLAGSLDRRLDDLATRFEALRTAASRLALPIAETLVEQLENLLPAVNKLVEAFERLAHAKRSVERAQHLFAKGLGDLLGLPPAPEVPSGGGGTWEAPGTERALDFGSERRVARLKEIMRLLNLNEAAATDALKAIKAFEDTQGAQKLRDQLEKARSAAVGLKDELAAAARGTEGLAVGLRGGRPRPAIPAAGPFQPEGELQFDALTRGREQFRDFADEVLDIGNIVRDGMLALTSTLTQGIQGLLEAFVFRTQSISKAIVDLFKSMVSEILGQLARLVAIKLISSIFLPGVVPTPANLGNIPLPSPAFAPAGGSFARSAGSGGGAFRAAPSVTNVNVNISAFDTRSASDQFADPYGAVRQAFRRSAEVQAA